MDVRIQHKRLFPDRQMTRVEGHREIRPAAFPVGSVREESSTSLRAPLNNLLSGYFPLVMGLGPVFWLGLLSFGLGRGAGTGLGFC